MGRPARSRLRRGGVDALTQTTESADVVASGLPSLRRKLASDSGWALGGRVLTVAIGFGTSALLARLLRPSDFGLYVLLTSLSGALSAIAQFGLPATGTRLIAEAMATGLQGRARATARRVLALSGGIAAGIALIGISPPGRALLGTLFDVPGLREAIGLTMLVTLLATFQYDLGELFRGLSRILPATVHGGLLASALTFAVFVALRVNLGRVSLETVLWWTVASMGVACLVSGGMLHVRLRTLRGPGTAGAAELLRLSSPLFVYGVMALVVAQVDVWAIGAIRPADLAVYGAAARLVLLVSIPLLIVNAVVPPVIAALYARGEHQRLEHIVRVAATLSGIPAFGVLAVFVLLGRPVMQIVYGDFYGAGAVPLAVLSVGAAFAVATGSCGMVLIMTGYQRVVMVTSFVAGIVTIAAVFVGGVTGGSVGIACGAAGGKILQNLFQVVACRRVLGLRTEINLAAAWDEGRRFLTRGQSALSRKA